MEMFLQVEIGFRKSQGQEQVTLDAVKRRLADLGYRLDRSSDCRSFARYMSGERAGVSYPCLTTGIVEADTGMSFAHVDARRDENFDQLQKLRFSGEEFAVVGGCILDL
ncbi:hypothetical protein [Aromatoleum evansii]|uniref:hypothetical protein n=1 Tax=Aromatoleum evansii TaxID=59406 RepID=UPI00145CCF71|nr:hypothetical protein [Aromatoleum evansii]NMG29565.1 hypothetical protein [Aromatoleum evansii]